MTDVTAWIRPLSVWLGVWATVLVACSTGDGAVPAPVTDPGATAAVTDRSAAVSSLPATTALASTVEPPAGGSVPVGFESVVASITDPDGSVCEVCVWLADDGDRRSRGLMFVDDLAGRAGMAFVYDAPRTTSFTMRNTMIPLSIAFFDADGAFVASFDMEPCRGEPCPSYPTPEGFTVALEVPKGDLDGLGIGPGAQVTVTGEPCPAHG